VIFAAALLETVRLLQAPVATDWIAMGVGTLVSAVVAYLTIRYFLRFLGRIGMLPFAIYRLLLALLIVYVFG